MQFRAAVLALRVTTLVGSTVAALALVAGCTGAFQSSGVESPDDSEPERPGASGGRGGSTNAGGSGATGGSAGRALAPTTRFARLSHRQWENTTRDLLRLPAAPGVAGTFSGDAVMGRFDQAGGTLQVTDGLFRDYQRAAELMAEKVSSDAGWLAQAFPKEAPTEAAARARFFVERFGQRAFRRPLASSELDRYSARFVEGARHFSSGDASRDGVRAVVEAMLQSPHFLYRVERATTTGPDGFVALDDWEVASRLSYALVSSMPDDTLFDAARTGKLRTAEDVARHARRLLASDAGRATLDDFHAQLLRLKIYDGIDKDRAKFPAFAAGIGADMRDETIRFSRDVVTSGGGLADLLTASRTFVNQRLASIYGLSGITGTEMRKVELDPTRRAGLLTQIGFLASNAHRDEIDSIHRGVFVHLNVLCTELPPPAANVAPVPGVGGKTNRQRVDAHTGEGTCGAICHAKIINPAGFAFEHYDALGAYRTTDNGEPIDATGAFVIDGEKVTFKDGVDLSKRMAASVAAHGCFTRAWLEYLHGRAPADEDEPWTAPVIDASRAGRASIEDLVVALVTSDFFRRRAP